jgi:hypothetical protein
MFNKRSFATVLAIGATLCISISTASANVVFNERQPFNFLFFNACTGEDVSVDGIFHSVVREKIGEDGSVSINERINAHGFGSGLSSGAEYVWNDTVAVEIEDLPPVSFSLRQQGFLRLIGKGQTPNLLLRGEFVFRIDSTGVFFDGIENLSCVPD